MIEPPRSLSHQIMGLLGWLLLAFIAAVVGAIASVNAGSFYETLNRPAWAPPAWLFGPVWSTLYLMMGISAWLVWRARDFAGTRLALSLFIIQLAVNGCFLPGTGARSRLRKCCFCGY